MEYFRWTPHELHLLILGHGISGICNKAEYEGCMVDPRGCSSILSQGWAFFPGKTLEEKQENRARQAKEVQARCRQIKVTIEEVPA